MTVEVVSENSFDSTFIAGSFLDFVNELNLAAASNKKFAIVTEESSGKMLALNTMSIIRVREVDGSDAFVG